LAPIVVIKCPFYLLLLMMAARWSKNLITQYLSLVFCWRKNKFYIYDAKWKTNHSHFMRREVKFTESFLLSFKREPLWIKYNQKWWVECVNMM
jgi:hypothetical protein